MARLPLTRTLRDSQPDAPPPPDGFPARTGHSGPPPRPRRRRRIPLGPRRWRGIAFRLTGAAVVIVAGLVFRRAIAATVLAALTAILHLAGINAHLPHVRFAWPWQSITAPHTSDTDLGPWVLQKVEGISRPALATASFDFLFTHKVSKSLGPWPCWYSSTFHAVARVPARVDLNPGPSWWAPGTGHYRLQVLSRPSGSRPGEVAVRMVLPQPQLPQSVHDVTIDNIPSKPVDTQHSWTYPGLGCGALLRPQFPESVLYAQAQGIAFYRAGHLPPVTRPLIAAAESQATTTVRDNFIQPVVNAFGYRLNQFTVSWAGAA